MTQTAFFFSTNCTTHGKAIDVIDLILYYEKCTKHKANKKAESIINPTTQTLVASPKKWPDGKICPGLFGPHPSGGHAVLRKGLPEANTEIMKLE
ncbi:MAG: hypothetical protein WD431_01030 [Cyclobacteriaceae bacterium]